MEWRSISFLPVVAKIELILVRNFFAAKNVRDLKELLRITFVFHRSGFFVPASRIPGSCGCFPPGQAVYPVSFSSQKVLIADVKITPYFSCLISPTPVIVKKSCRSQGFVSAISLRLLSGKMT